MMFYIQNISFKVKATIIFLAILCISNNSYAQQYNLRFKHLTTNDGLSDNTITSILQDKNGFMWFTTMHGINKYDGYEFTQYYYNSEIPGAIGTNVVVKLFEDSYGIMWLASDETGVYLFNKKNETFHQLANFNNSPNGLSSNNIRDIFEDSERNLWIGTAAGGLNLFNRSDSSFTSFQNNPDDSTSIGSNFIASIDEDMNGDLWLGSTTGELIKFNKSDSSFTNYFLHKSDQLLPYANLYTTVLVDSDNDVWYGTLGGVFILNQTTGDIKHLQKGSSKIRLSSDAITDILEYEKGIFFITTDHGGINIYNKNTEEVSYHKTLKYDITTISNNQIRTIYRTSEGVIWVGCYNGGLNILNDKEKFQQYKFILQEKERLNCCNPTLAMCEDLDGNIWIGYDGQGIDIFNPGTKKTTHITANKKNSIKSDIVQTIYRDGQGDIWIGHYLDGISKFNWKTKTFSHITHTTTENDNLYLNNIKCISQEDENNYWLGTHFSGLKLYNSLENTYKIYQLDYSQGTSAANSLSSNFVNKIIKDSHGNIWVATTNKLNKYIKEIDGFKHYAQDKGIIGVSINDIYEDEQNNIWVGTEKALHLYQSEKDSFTHFNNNTAIETIFEDKNRDIWFSTNEGITKFYVNEKVFRNYNTSDGIQSMGFYNCSGLKAKDGTVYFGGQNGFTSFSPDKITDKKNKSSVFITEFRISNKVISHKDSKPIINKHINFVDEIHLNYSQKDLYFKFSNLCFINPKKNKFKYMLEGFDKAWINNGTKHEATYTNLPPGKYTLKIKSTNNNEQWDNNSKNIIIIITPPFWKTKWFILFEIILTLVIISIIFRWRNSKLKKNEHLLKRIVGERTKEINQQNEDLNEVNALLEESKEEVRQQNEQLLSNRDLLEDMVKERTAKLDLALQKAEESDKLKSAFLANMSHEIRTPLNAIVGFASFLTAPDITEEEKQEFVSTITNNSDSLLMLIDDILDFSLIEANQLTINKQTFYVNELVDNLYSNFFLSNSNATFKIYLKNELPEDLLKIYSDRHRLKQILNNLLQNAIKFTSEGYIELGVHIKDSNLVFYVKDTGIGISESNQKKIFQRFIKSEDQHNENFRGVGLGLSISKRLAEILSGKLSLESKLGEGSTFYLTIPLGKIKTNNDIIIPDNKRLAIKKWANKRILIVEDEPTNYLFLKKALERTSSKITWAKNGKEAVEIYKSKEDFDLILMDIKMPEMDGYTALKIIKEIAPQQIIIAQTAYARPEDEIKLNKAGFDDYLSKPIKPNLLYNTLERYL